MNPTAENDLVRVLVVDDEEEIALVLARALTDAGYDVTLAASGQAALDRLGEGPYQLLLTDIYMPALRGDELMIRALETDPTLAVMLVTAIDDTACAVECLKRGACDFLLKPFDLDDVIVRVAHALDRRRLERESAAYRLSLEARVAEATDQLRRTVQQALESLIHTLEAKDPFTQNHSLRVADTATELVTRMRPGDARLHAQVRIAGLFHDIGKIGIPEHILHKPGALTDEERAIVQRHPEMSALILAPMLDTEIVRIVRSHHESWDGGGYPDRLAGEDIPLGARILAVSDAYDAMTSVRPHRPALPLPQVLSTLYAGAGQQWDQEAVVALLKLVAGGRLEGIGHATGSAAQASALAASMLDGGKMAFVATRSAAPAASREEPPRGARPVIAADGAFDERKLRELRDRLEGMLQRDGGGGQIVLDIAGWTDATAETVHAVHALDLMTRRRGRRLVLRDASHALRSRLSDAQLDDALLYEESLKLAA